MLFLRHSWLYLEPRWVDILHNVRVIRRHVDDIPFKPTVIQFSSARVMR